MSAVFGLVLIKIIAVRYGPELLGEFGLYRQYLQVLTVLLTFGNGFALIEAVSKNKEKVIPIGSYLLYYLIAIAILSLLHVLIAPIVGGQIFDVEMARLVWVMPLTFVGLGLFHFVRSSLSGFLFSTPASLLQSLPFLIMSIMVFFMGDLPFVFMVAYLVSFLLCFIYALPKLQVSWKLRWQRDVLFEKTSVSTILTGIAGFVSLFVVKYYTKEVLGIEYNGYLEANWSLGAYSNLIVLNGLSLFYLPLLSKLEGAEQAQFMRQIFRLVGFASTLILLPLLLFHNLIFEILFSPEIAEYSHLFCYVAVAEIFRSYSWFFIFSFLSLSLKKRYIFIDLFCNSLFAIAALLMLNAKWQMQGVLLAYVLFQVVYFVANIVWFPVKKTIGYQHLGLAILNVIAFLALSHYIT